MPTPIKPVLIPGHIRRNSSFFFSSDSYNNHYYVLLLRTKYSGLSKNIHAYVISTTITLD